MKIQIEASKVKPGCQINWRHPSESIWYLQQQVRRFRESIDEIEQAEQSDSYSAMEKSGNNARKDIESIISWMLQEPETLDEMLDDMWHKLVERQSKKEES